MVENRQHQDLDTIIDRREQIFGYQVPGAKYAPPRSPRPPAMQDMIEKSIELSKLNTPAPIQKPGVFFVDSSGIIATAQSLDGPEPPGVFAPLESGRLRRDSTSNIHHEWGKDRPEARARARDRVKVNGYINGRGTRDRR